MMCAPDNAAAQRAAIRNSSRLKEELWGSLEHLVHELEELQEGRLSKVSLQMIFSAALH
jgi:hypothetical protein